MPLPERSAAIDRLSERLEAVSRRLWMREIIRVVLIAAPLTGVLAGLLVRVGGSGRTAASATIAVAAAVLWIRGRRSHWTAAMSAEAVERAIPASRNLVVTAEELTRHANRARPWIRSRV